MMNRLFKAIKAFVDMIGKLFGALFLLALVLLLLFTLSFIYINNQPTEIDSNGYEQLTQLLKNSEVSKSDITSFFKDPYNIKRHELNTFLSLLEVEQERQAHSTSKRRYVDQLKKSPVSYD